MQLIGILGQADSPESLKISEVTEMAENLIKVTKYLTKLTETLMSFVWKKSHVKKQLEKTFR